MNDRFDYRPPFGLDISVKSRKRTTTRKCAEEGCNREATAKVAKSPTEPRSYIWYCPGHAREHNRAWDFFKEMDEAEQRAWMERERNGHRPTWPFGRSTTSARAARASSSSRGFREEMEDAFGVFEDGPKEARSGTTHQHRSSVSPMIAKALAALDLETNATKEDIRGRYRELVRRFHPDTGGEDGDEKQLRRVMDAYRVLKSGGRC